jgi:hypothetical protein
MSNPNAAAMFKWTNNFAPGAPNESQDFLQLIRQSDGAVLGYIDPSGVPQGSLALASGGGVRVLKGAFGTNYVVDSESWVDVDATNLSTTITVPVGFTLVVTVAACMNFGAEAALMGIAIDGTIVNYTNADGAAGVTSVVGNAPAALIASFTGDGASHVVALQGLGDFIIESANGEDGPIVPVMTLVLAPSI